MKVLVLTKYPRMGASSRLRTLQFLPLLETSGFEFTVQSLFDNAYLENLYNNGNRSKLASIRYYFKRFLTLLTVKQYDLIWIEKELFPYFPAFFEKILVTIGVRYIVDYDDAIFHNYDFSKNKLIKFFLKKKIDKVMKYSSCVMAGNNYLATRAKSSGAKNIKLRPTVVDHLKYETKEDVSKDLLTIGWIGSPTTQKYITEIAPMLYEINRQCSFRLLLVGATTAIKKDLQGLEVDIYPWDENTEADLIRLMDIGIMPLHDGPWEKGKCGYKLIQYMASGVPVIASDVGVNREIIENSKSGLLVKEQSDWSSTIVKLINSPNLRAQFGEAGRDAVEQNYSIQSQLPKINKILNSFLV